MFGLCNLAIIPLRREPDHRSELVSQVLFGEHFRILERNDKWTKIQLQYDEYEGWLDTNQFQVISEESYNILSEKDAVFNADLIEYVTMADDRLLPIPLGAEVSFLKYPEINISKFDFEGSEISGVRGRQSIIVFATMYLNAPYLWGGKTAFGIDCSGFTQMVYKLSGYKLKRDAAQQSKQGETLSFIEESEPGDLAFFDNEKGQIVHTGIILENNYIIHSSGKVRIDRLDHLGIFNSELNKHTHRLRVIKKIL